MNSLKFKEKKINFINRLKYAEHKISCICIEVYKIYDGNDYDKIYEVLSTLKNIKLKINILIQKSKDMLENPDFEQDYYSRTAESIYKIGHDSVRLMKWLAYYDRSYYVIINHYDLIGSGSAITSSTFSLINPSIRIPRASCSALLTSIAILITNEYISKLKTRYTKIGDWINVITLLYEKTLKQSMID